MQLISEYNYYKDKETLTNDGYFYSTVEHLENETCLSGHEQRKAIAVLKELKVMYVMSKGIPAKRHFKIKFEGLAKLFDKIEKDRISRKQRHSQILKNLTTSNKNTELQADDFFNTNNKIYKENNNKIDRLEEYINCSYLEENEKTELESEFKRLEINLTEDYIKILSQTAYRRFLLMRAVVKSLFCSPHKYKLQYLNSKRLFALYDKYAEFEEKSRIDEPVNYFKKIILEYMNEQIRV